MKIPVTRDELGNGSFTSIAKYAARHWPEDKPLSLARAQNVVAESFGYDDLHDLQKSAQDQLPPVTPTIQQAQELVAHVLSNKHELSTEKALAFARQWPLSKLRFTSAPAGGVDCPITRHRQWRYLLRDLASLPEFRWLSTMTTERAMIALQPIAAIARAIAIWQPELIGRDQLALDIIGATDIECSAGGRLYSLLPRFWGRSDMRIDLHLVGLEARRNNMTALPGLPEFEAKIIRRRFGDYRHAPEYRRPDVTIVANPGLSDRPEEWLTIDDGLLDEAARHPLLWLGYDWDDAEVDQMIMQAFGLQEVGQVDRNPFYVECSGDRTGITFTYGMASWRSEAGVRDVPDSKRNRILQQIDRVNDFTTVSGLDVEAHNDATSKVRILGERQQVERADGRMDQYIVLGKRYYVRTNDGAIVDIPGKGALPHDTGERVPAELLAAYPGQPGARWIDRACWAAQVWLDKLDKFNARFLLRGDGEDDYIGNHVDAFFANAGLELDPAHLEQLRAALVPEKRKPIRPEHKPFIRALNEGQFEHACAMLNADPTLAAAENDEGQTALFYACQADDVALATAYADAGGDLEHADRETWSALSDAARHNSASVIAFLATRGIDIEHGNAMGWTPLQVTFTYGSPEAAVALAKAGADLDRKSIAGWTPRERATQLGLTSVIEAGKRTK